MEDAAQGETVFHIDFRVRVRVSQMEKKSHLFGGKAWGKGSFFHYSIRVGMLIVDK